MSLADLDIYEQDWNMTYELAAEDPNIPVITKDDYAEWWRRRWYRAVLEGQRQATRVRGLRILRDREKRS